MNRRDMTLEAIAKEHLRVDTLVKRDQDTLDFYNVSVVRIRQALRAAYAAGLAAAAQAVNDIKEEI